MEKKYYCRQVNPEFADSYLFYQFKNKKTGHYELAFEDDYYANDVIITGNKDFMEYWPTSLENLTKNLEWFNDDLNGWYGEKGQLTELANYYFKKWNGKRWSKRELAQWKRVSELTDNYSKENEEEALLLALKLLTGKEWRSITIRGYCQRDWQTGYVSEDINDKALNYLEMCYFNTGEEFMIYESKENFDNEEADFSLYVDGYKVKDNLSIELGCEPEELEVYAYDGYIKTPKYVLVD